MAKIKVNAEMLRSNSNALNSKIQELTQMNQTLDSLMMRIGDSWDGDASNAYVNMMRNYKSKAEEMVSVLNEFKKYVDEAVNKFESTDQSAASRLRGSF